MKWVEEPHKDDVMDILDDIDVDEKVIAKLDEEVWAQRKKPLDLPQNVRQSAKVSFVRTLTLLKANRLTACF